MIRKKFRYTLDDLLDSTKILDIRRMKKTLGKFKRRIIIYRHGDQFFTDDGEVMPLEVVYAPDNQHYFEGVLALAGFDELRDELEDETLTLKDAQKDLEDALKTVRKSTEKIENLKSKLNGVAVEAMREIKKLPPFTF